MTDIDLDALEALARKATPGPWSYDSDGDPEVHYILGPVADRAGSDAYVECEQADAEFIAAANPSTVLTLIADLRIARADRSDARRQRDEERTAKEGNVRALDAALADLRRAQECIDAIREADEDTDDFDLFGRSVKYILTTYDEGSTDDH